MRVFLLLIVILCTTSCGYLVDMNQGTPVAGESPFKVRVGGVDSSRDMCEFSIQPPSGNGWHIGLSKWGPTAFGLRFSRVRDKLLLRGFEGVFVYSVEDTVPLAHASTDGEWFRRLIPDQYSSPQIEELELTIEGVDSLVLEGREFHVVPFSVEYYIGSSRHARGHILDRGVVYVMRSPCHQWPGSIVFCWFMMNCRGHASLPASGALEVMSDMMRSFASDN